MLRDPQRSCELHFAAYNMSSNLQYMLRDLQCYLARRQPVDIVYIDRTGQLTQRRVRLLRVEPDHVRAYCYERRAVRTFAVANILAALPAREGGAA